MLRSQRTTQVVGTGITKRLEVIIRFFQGRSAFTHAFVQVFRVHPEMRLRFSQSCEQTRLFVCHGLQFQALAGQLKKDVRVALKDVRLNRLKQRIARAEIAYRATQLDKLSVKYFKCTGVRITCYPHPDIGEFNPCSRLR